MPAKPGEHPGDEKTWTWGRGRRRAIGGAGASPGGWRRRTPALHEPESPVGGQRPPDVARRAGPTRRVLGDPHLHAPPITTSGNWSPKTDFPVLTKRIPTWPWADPKERHIVSYDEYVKTGGYVGLRKALGMKPDAVTEEVKKSVLRGRGGAGFPCGLKWTFLPKIAVDANGHEADPGQRYLAVNADESEPGTFKDRMLMDFDPHLMLEGIAIACYACRIKTAFVFIRGEYHH